MMLLKFLWYLFAVFFGIFLAYYMYWLYCNGNKEKFNEVIEGKKDDEKD